MLMKVGILVALTLFEGLALLLVTSRVRNGIVMLALLSSSLITTAVVAYVLFVVMI